MNTKHTPAASTEAKWSKTGTSSYQFEVDGQVICQMDFSLQSISSKAKAQFDGLEYTIQRAGFWKNGIEISDASGQVLAIAQTEKWYSNALLLSYRGADYQLKIHNNPLATWSLYQDGQPILSYGLGTQDGKASVQISGQAGFSDTLLHCLLWYLFAPIAAENCGDDMSVLLLLTV